MSEKVLRNPTQDEIKKLHKTQSTAAQPVYKKYQNEEEKVNFFAPKASEFKLPSGHLVVPSGVISMRRMTTIEENMFYELLRSYADNAVSFNSQKFSQTFLSTANAVIDNCITSDISIYDLLVIDQVPLFINLVKLTYGAVHEFPLYCDTCTTTTPTEINLDELSTKYVDANIEYPKTFDTTSFEFPVQLIVHYLRIADELIWSDNVSSLTQKYMTILSQANGTLPDGNPITEDQYANIINNLNEADKTQIKEWLNLFSEHGLSLKINKKFCKNKSCSKYNKQQEVELPLETIFQKVFNAI